MSDVLSFYYNISIHGKPLSEDRRKCIASVSLSDLDNGSDTCTIVVKDPEFKYIEDNIFIEESPVYVEMGWLGITFKSKFTGYISAIDIDFPQEGCPQLSIFCLDNTHKMNREKKTRSWDNVTRADVVKKIAAEYGFKCVVQKGYSSEKDTISQSGVTDIEFCENLASEETDLYKCKLVGNTLYYIKRGILSTAKATLGYKTEGFEVISFSPSINKETKKESVKSSDIDSNSKTVDSATASDSTTERETQGSPVESTTKVGFKYNPKTGKWDKTNS